MDENQLEKEIEKFQKQEVVLQELDKNKPEAEKLLQDKHEIEHFLKQLETKLSLIPIAEKFLYDAPVMISLVRDYVDKTYTDIPAESVITIVSALMYISLPVDIIPDFILEFGYIDDVAVLRAGDSLVKDDYEKYKKWKVGEGE